MDHGNTNGSIVRAQSLEGVGAGPADCYVVVIKDLPALPNFPFLTAHIGALAPRFKSLDTDKSYYCARGDLAGSQPFSSGPITLTWAVLVLTDRLQALNCATWLLQHDIDISPEYGAHRTKAVSVYKRQQAPRAMLQTVLRWRADYLAHQEQLRAYAVGDHGPDAGPGGINQEHPSAPQQQHRQPKQQNQQQVLVEEQWEEVPGPANSPAGNGNPPDADAMNVQGGSRKRSREVPAPASRACDRGEEADMKMGPIGRQRVERDHQEGGQDVEVTPRKRKRTRLHKKKNRKPDDRCLVVSAFEDVLRGDGSADDICDVRLLADQLEDALFHRHSTLIL